MTHLILRQADGTLVLVGSAVRDPSIYTDGGGIGMYVDPGQTRARPGIPLVIDMDGTVELQLMIGGRPMYTFEQLSGLVRVEVIS